ncbi:flavin reductase domain-containing protein [Nocardioides sp. CF8]|nr:flavin reductase domain-containing protein [Nocardioides sp. CF8]
MADDARASWPPRELIDSFLGNFPHDFEWRPGETIEVDGEEAQNQARLFRDVLGRYASGVTVVTTVSDGVPVGMTCQSFTSVSLDPPLVAFLPTRQSRAFASIQRAGTFCVNFLASDQEQVSNQFASSGDDKFAGVSWTPSKDTGSPLLAGIVGHVDCTVHAVHEAGDHYLVIGKVVDLAAGDAEDPLLYYRGGYRTAT